MPFLGKLRSKSIPSARARRCARATLATTLAALCIADANAGTATGSLALTNDDVFRGISQTNRKPAVQGSLEYDADSGFYIGTWDGNVSWLSDQSTSTAPVSSDLEVDLYAGYRHKLGGKVTLDVGALSYIYPGKYPAGFTSPNTTELYAGVTAGIASLKYSRSTGNLFGFADSRGSGYVEAAANWEFTPGWTLNVHAGQQTIAHHHDYNYTDWRLGVTKAWKNGYSIAVAYAGTDARTSLYTNAFGTKVAGATGVLALSKSF